KNQIESRTEIGARFRLTYTALSKITLPLPPLDLQHAIVEILGTFSALETELEAELEARKQQYNYYRDAFFANSPEPLWKPLSSLGIFERGSSFQKKHLQDEGIPCFHYGQVYTHYGVSTESTLSYLSPEF